MITEIKDLLAFCERLLLSIQLKLKITFILKCPSFTGKTVSQKSQVILADQTYHLKGIFKDTRVCSGAMDFQAARKKNVMNIIFVQPHYRTSSCQDTHLAFSSSGLSASFSSTTREKKHSS